MTVERREEKVGKPLLTGSALGGDKFRDICNMETIPPETDVLINDAHFPSFTSSKFPFPKSPTKWTIHVTGAPNENIVQNRINLALLNVL